MGKWNNYTIYNNMEEKEILELIQTVVRPLRERLDKLERENQMIKTKIGCINISLHTPNQPIRQRSSKSIEKQDPNSN